ncbi:MAG: aminopeptidase, partial [Thermoplasmata archaeon]|nr:aminopeptidase [Thermoplasmata archaeon]
VVVDGSIGDIGSIDEHLYMTVENGRLVKMECENPETIKRIEELMEVDEKAKIIGELGIGLNPNARLVGNLLEDEKAGETAHIAFGNNMDMDKGQNNSKTHRDFLFKKPTFVVTYTDGSKRTIIKDGKVTLD